MPEPVPVRRGLDQGDLAFLRAAGIAPDEARRQAALLADPPPPPRLLRPCTLGDGIVRLDPARARDYQVRGAALLRRESVAKFVPASGAATRLFRDLLAEVAGDAPGPGPAARGVLDSAERFAFAQDWRAAAEAAGTPFAARAEPGLWRGALRALLESPGLGYAGLPKAVIPFHRGPGRPRTPVEEHWREAAALGLGQLHLTLSPGHVPGLLELVDRLRSLPDGGDMVGVRLTHSVQDPATDTLAGDGYGGVFRDEDGKPVLRPAGHGALLANLAALAPAAGTALVRNIDNIAHAGIWRGQLNYKWTLLGLLDEVAASGPRDAPVRVVGVVPNTGQPGGGPFWVEGREHPQIVEAAQVASEDPAQRAVFASGTHFNPVDMVCRLTGADGRPLDLARFCDPEAVFLSAKSHRGRPLVALERPGLWNGAMAFWRTVLVELPLETFNPVKTVDDLLLPAHQWAGR